MSGMDNGAHFHCCDLQVHSPRDRGWTGPKPVSDADRLDYARRLIAACRERGVDALAVTDHHDMAFASYVRAAAAEELGHDGKPLAPDQRVAVFPGMELTLGVPCQALLVFDASLPEDLFPLVLNALALTPAANGAASTVEVQRLDKIETLRALKDKLDEHAFLRDRFIILPHVGNSGDFSLLRKGFPGKYIDMPCVGGFIDGTIEKLDTGNKRILAGEDASWGNKRVAVVQTSDARHDDHRQLGRPATWIKWAEPTAEALRQACLAQESRITHAPPHVPDTYIAAISVSNSLFLGPADLAFNPQYNALIGGRGTGKSTLLEYLRWALCDQPPLIEDGENPNYQLRRSRLIEATLARYGASIDVTYMLNGVPHLVRRSARDGRVLLKIADGELGPCTEEEVRSLLPIQAYSQKQLSDVSVRLEELHRFVVAPVQVELNRLERDAADRANKLRQHHAALERFREITRQLGNRALEERSLTQQAGAIRASLGGLSVADRALLDQGQDFVRASHAVASWQAGAASLGDAIADLRQQIGGQREGAPPAPGAPVEHRDTLAEAHQLYAHLLEDAERALATIAERAEVVAAGGDAGSAWHRWAAANGDFRGRYDEATRRSSSHRERLLELDGLEVHLEKLSRDLAMGREQLAALGSAEIAYRAAREEWVETLRSRDDLIEAECARLTERSGGTIRVTMRRFGDAAAFAAALRQAVQGSGMQSAKLDAIARAITTAEDPRATWFGMLDEIETLAAHDNDRDGAEARPPAPRLAAAGLTPNDIGKLAHSLRPSSWLNLSLVPVASVPEYAYRSREGSYLSFADASAGQQATALLKTLLNSPGPPLIIDQPEEDLDNPVMLEVVEQLWRAKGMRQIVFASHNANLVVNGDAELVAWFGYRTDNDQSRGTIIGEGAIDIADARDAIQRIMEGGEAAFRLRQDKYGF